MKYPLLFVLLTCLHAAGAQPEKMLGEAEALSAAGRYEASNALLGEFMDAHPGRLYDKGEALFLRSYNYLQLGNLAAALADNAASLELLQQFIPEDAAKNYLRAGAIYLRQGQYERALAQLFRSEAFPLIDAPQTAARIKEHFGHTFAELKQYERARQYYQQSLDILLIEEGEEAPAVAINYYYIGRAYLLEGNTEAAWEWMEKALAVEKGLAGGAARKGQLYDARGELAFRDRAFQKAEACYALAREAFQSPDGGSRRELGGSLIALAELRLSTEDTAGARYAVQEALRQLCPGFAGARIEDNPGPEQLSLSRLLLARALSAKAALLLKAGGQEHLGQALAASQRGIEALEEEAALLIDEGNRLAILEAHIPIFEAGITAACRLYRATGNPAQAEKAFELSERARALALRLNRIHGQGLAQLPPELQEEEARLRYAMKAAEADFNLYPGKAGLQQKLERRRQAYRAFAESLQSASPAYYRQRFALELATPQQLQGKLGKKQAMLAYFTGNGHYFIFALADGSFTVSQLSAGPDEELKLPALTDAIDGYLKAIRQGDEQNFAFYSGILYKRLILPVKELLDEKEELIILPHGKLVHIPFEALSANRMDKPEKVKLHKLDYLIGDVAVQYRHSASLFARAGAPSGNYGEGLLGMAPVFNQQANDNAIGSSNAFVFDTAYQQSRSLLAAAPGGRRFLPLPLSEIEMNGILEQFSGKKQTATALLRAEASEPAFRERAGHCRYLHLATHGFINEATPALSGIAFAQKEGGSAEDGILFCPEAAALTLQAELVVISNCESGMGQLAEGEGALSLSRSFLDAGASNVIISLWKPASIYAVEMMAPLYKELLGGQNPAAALRQAKLGMIRAKATAAPAIWSGLLLFGE